MSKYKTVKASLPHALAALVMLICLFFPKNASAAIAPIFNLDINVGYGPIYEESQVADTDQSVQSERQLTDSNTLVSILPISMRGGLELGFLWKGGKEGKEGSISSLFSLYAVGGVTYELYLASLYGGLSSIIAGYDLAGYTKNPYLSDAMSHAMIGVYQQPFFERNINILDIYSLNYSLLIFRASGGLGVSILPSLDLLLSLHWQLFTGLYEHVFVAGEVATFYTLGSVDRNQQFFFKLTPGFHYYVHPYYDELPIARSSSSYSIDSSSVDDIPDIEFDNDFFYLRAMVGYSFTVRNDDEIRARALGFDVFYSHMVQIFADHPTFTYFDSPNSVPTYALSLHLKYMEKHTDEFSLIFTFNNFVGLKGFYRFKIHYSDVGLFEYADCAICEFSDDPYFDGEYIRNVTYASESASGDTTGSDESIVRSRMNDHLVHQLGLSMAFPALFVVGIRAEYELEVRDYYRHEDFLALRKLTANYASLGPTFVSHRVKIGIPIKFCEGLTSVFEPYYSGYFGKLFNFSAPNPEHTIVSHTGGFDLTYRLKGKCRS